MFPVPSSHALVWVSQGCFHPSKCMASLLLPPLSVLDLGDGSHPKPLCLAVSPVHQGFLQKSCTAADESLEIFLEPLSQLIMYKNHPEQKRDLASRQLQKLIAASARASLVP